MLSENNNINLDSYILTVWRHKIGGLVIVFLTLSIAVIINLFVLIPIYESESLIEIGKIKGAPIDSTNSISRLFSSAYFLEQIRSRADLPKSILLSEVASSIFIGPDLTKKGAASSEYLKISARSDSPEETIKLVNTCTSIVIENHQKIFDEAEKIYELETATIEREKEKMEIDINNVQQEISRIEKDINYYQAEIKQKSNTTNNAQGKIAAGYISLLAGSKDQRQEKINTLAALKKELKNFDLAFQQKKYEKIFNTKMTQIQSLPLLPEEKIGPARRKNVMTSGILGIFFAIFYAFIAEYALKFKQARKSNPSTIVNLT